MAPAPMGVLPLRVRVLPFLSHSASALASIPTQTRCLHAKVKTASIPEPTPFCPDPTTFLTLIGRQLSQHASKIPTWEALFTLTPVQLRDLGIEPPRSRKYLLEWRERFRRGEFGIGGDCKHVDSEGRAELRIVQVPIGTKLEEAAWAMKHGSGSVVDTVRRSTGAAGGINVTPGTRKVVVNVPVSAAYLVGTQPDAPETEAAEAQAGEAGEQAEAALEEGKTELKEMRDLTPEELDLATPVSQVKIRKEIVGSHVNSIRGTRGLGAVIKVQEGLWEHRRGHKVDGGERRKAEVQAKRRSSQRRAAAR